MSNNSANDIFGDLLDPAALALATEAYGRPKYVAPIIRTVTRGESVSTPIAPKNRAKVAPSGVKPSLGLPAKGTLTPAGFLAAIRTAGVRQQSYQEESVDPITGEIAPVTKFRFSERGTPIMMHDAIIARADEKAAVAAFMGWDPTLPHGTQLDAARRSAYRILERVARADAGMPNERYTHRSPEAHAAKWSVDGFVAGMPNAVQKLMADLAGRSRLAEHDFAFFGSLITSIANDPGDPRRAIESMLSKEFPSEKGIDPVVDDDGKEIGYKVVERHNPIAQRIRSAKGEELVKLLSSLEALASARLASIREDLAGVDASADGAPDLVSAEASREFHAPIRAGETNETYEARLQSAQDLYDLSQVASGSTSEATEARKRCFAHIVERTHRSLLNRGLPATIEEEFAHASDSHGILDTAPKG